MGHVDPRNLVGPAGALFRIPSFNTGETSVTLFLDEILRQRG
jgi:hypothetical protein